MDNVSATVGQLHDAWQSLGEPAATPTDSEEIRALRAVAESFESDALKTPVVVPKSLIDFIATTAKKPSKPTKPTGTEV